MNFDFSFNFELILFYATLIAGVIALADILIFAPRRQRLQKESFGGEVKMPLLFDYARSFFPILLIVFLLRSFLFEPFRIPSTSLQPTLLIGDFILVNKFDYGIRLPVIHKKIWGKGTPKRGDIIVFRWPPNESVDFIKRVVGVPGDKISYINKELYVNGEKIPQTYLKNAEPIDETGMRWEAQEKLENLFGVNHKIYLDPEKPSQDYENIPVPEGMYFVLGDNRDNSADSRYWGFVPDKNIIGKAVLIWMSWDKTKTNVRWSRLGSLIQ